MAAETQNESGFLINDIRHEIPTLDTFTMDEAQVLYDYSGLAIEDFMSLAPLPKDADEETQEAWAEERAELDGKLRNPGFLRALMHVAYQRANPNLSAAKVKTQIGTADLMTNFAEFLESGVDEDDADPPESTTKPEPSSPKSLVESNDPSGKSSEPSSEEQGGQAEPTTTGDSDTSLASALTSSAA